ncbi:hypothetical protein BCR34DRAFT_267693 [Clohesyomyces aquaticus]|uniref:Uncharacterized protein n=1 Tax=Clohesyomyces aquaticus TaxID=1231657 RepID=A0A1Y1ZT11_9PLEO|nr:hypothetical protein BCR34DRAFT_267693 [Clohesyomyces aquaticus]
MTRQSPQVNLAIVPIRHSRFECPGDPNQFCPNSPFNNSASPCAGVDAGSSIWPGCRLFHRRKLLSSPRSSTDSGDARQWCGIPRLHLRSPPSRARSEEKFGRSAPCPVSRLQVSVVYYAPKGSLWEGTLPSPQRCKSLHDTSFFSSDRRSPRDRLRLSFFHSNSIASCWVERVFHPCIFSICEVVGQDKPPTNHNSASQQVPCARFPKRGGVRTDSNLNSTSSACRFLHRCPPLVKSTASGSLFLCTFVSLRTAA